jgi:hypothetical protein
MEPCAILNTINREMAERFKVRSCKACKGITLSRVRIPLSEEPNKRCNNLEKLKFRRKLLLGC